jgi:hypothetical protein
LAPDEIERLTQACGAHDYLGRILGEIEALQRIVFHANQRADWSRVRRSAQQILMAEIVYRYQGHPEKVYFALRALEDGGQSWPVAIRELAAAMHSYFTTPLGLVMRQELFGEEVVFITPDAYDWTAQLQGRECPADGQGP